MSIWNTASLARAGHACMAGLALLVLGPSMAGAEYGPKTRIGTKYQQSSSETSVNGIDAGSCANQSSCYVLFRKASKQKALIVQHVSCRVTVNAGAPRFVTLQTRKGQTFPYRYTNLDAVTSTNGTYWIVSAPALHLVEPGERPVIRFANSVSASLFSLSCSISGHLE